MDAAAKAPEHDEREPRSAEGEAARDASETPEQEAPSPEYEALDRALEAALISRKIEIPPCPTATLTLQKRIAKGDFCAGELAKLVETDPALAAGVFRYANTAAQGLVKVESLRQAVVRLGTHDLLGVALACGIGESVASNGPLQHVRAQVWRESALRAVLGRGLAPAFGVEPSTGFLCGLLYDFGKLVAFSGLETILDEHPELACVMSSGKWMSLVDRHGLAVGGRVARRWKLPAPIPELMRARTVDADPQIPAARLLYTVEKVMRLFGRKARFIPGDPGAVVGNDRGLRAAIDGTLEELPAQVAALTQIVGNGAGKSPKGKAKRKRNNHVILVEYADNTLGKDTRPGDFPVEIVRGEEVMEVRGVAIAPDGLRAMGKEQVTEGYVLAMRLFPEEGQTAEMFVTVHRCSPLKAGGYSIELRPFTRGHEDRAAWMQVWDAQRFELETGERVDGDVEIWN